MTEKQIITRVIEYQRNEVPEEYSQIINDCLDAAQNAYSPYSGFQVGASVLLENGEIFKGSNQENAAYPSGLCAERVALFYANANHPDSPVKALAVCAFHKSKLVANPAPPCGSCRQVILESEVRFKKPIRILLVGENTIQVIENASSLLPLNFDGNFLQ